jgi:demethylmenaquinone methyltransferase/2-methoxy-6-polyprenyl-1,4-benzoquinol methylase
MSRASLDKQPHEVAAMFDGVSARYDRTNTLLSMGLDRSWRSSTRSA